MVADSVCCQIPFVRLSSAAAPVRSWRVPCGVEQLINVSGGRGAMSPGVNG